MPRFGDATLVTGSPNTDTLVEDCWKRTDRATVLEAAYAICEMTFAYEVVSLIYRR